eukprot:jgi/Ulvmu1/7212/UM034_0121.1
MTQLESRSHEERPMTVKRDIHDQSLQPAPDTYTQRCVNAVWSSGTWCMIIASCAQAVASFSVKLLKGRISVFQIVMIRSAVSLLTTMLAVPQMQRRDPDLRLFGQPSNYGKLVVRGAAGATGMTLYYASIKFLPLGDAVTIFFTNVIVTSLMSILAGYDAPGWSIAAACMSCIGGVGLITKPTFLFGSAGDSGPWHLAGVFAGLGSSVAAGVAFVCIRSLSGKEPAVVMTNWFHATSTVISVIPVLLGFPGPAVWPTLTELMILVAIVLGSFTGQLCLSRGFSMLAPSRAAAINLLQVVHARILSIAFLHEHIEASGIAGTVLVAAGVLVAQMGKNGAQAREQSVPLNTGTEIGRPGCSDEVQLLSLAYLGSVSSDDSLLEAHPVCIPVSELDAAQKSVPGDECAVFVPVQEVGNEQS